MANLGLLTLLVGTHQALADDHEPFIPDGEPPQSVPVRSVQAVGEAASPELQPVSEPEQPVAPLDIEAIIECINFNENRANTGGCSIPPDPIGAVGPDHLVSVVNTSIEWHNKEGTQQNGQSLASFFSVFSPVFLFDPKVIYDQFEERFVLVVLDRDDSAVASRILLAVSDDSDPNWAWFGLAINSLI